jgi:hypothetical protein
MRKDFPPQLARQYAGKRTAFRRDKPAQNGDNPAKSRSENFALIACWENRP